MQIIAPFTETQVQHLNEWQRSKFVHPFTCGNRDTAAHWELDPEGDRGVLVATTEGWICRHCEYTQTWAHDYMADGSLIEGYDPFKNA